MPGSASHTCFVGSGLVLKKAKERWSSSSVILLDSPGCRNTFNSFIGRETVGFFRLRKAQQFQLRRARRYWSP
jgi:hypothetical protein